MQDVRLGVMKALGDITRLQIVDILMNGEKTVQDLCRELNVTQPTLSHHLKILCGCDMTICRHEGTWHYYSLNSDMLRGMGKHLIGMADYIDDNNPETLAVALMHFSH